MPYIDRAIEPLVSSVAAEYSVILVTGPRQVGKSTLLQHVLQQRDETVEQVTLDDLSNRQLAIEDPAMFFQIHRPPILVDEVQYAPNLFSEIKMMVDKGAPAGSFWLTGSQQFRLMGLAGESLAGRAAILPLSSLTQKEVRQLSGGAFSLDIDFWRKRQETASPLSISQLFDAIFKGSMPSIDSGKQANLPVFYSSYIQTYIERDVRRLLGSVDALQYADFMRATAARCSQLLNVASIAQDVGIRQEKAKAWLAVLEKSGIIFYLHPYSNNQLKRTVRAPKLYFHDCGLVAHLTRWSSPETLGAGAMAGAFMENFVVSEVYKSFLNTGIEPPLYYYRDHDAKEIDLIIEEDGVLHPIEIKKTASPNLGMIRSFKTLDKGSMPVGRGAIVCAAQMFGALNANTLIIPAGLL